MDRVVLLDPSFPNNHDENFKFNIGLLSIGSYLKSKGIPTTVYYKGKHLKDALSDIAASDVMLVGISAMTIQFPSAITLARQIKSIKPDLKIVIGGCHARLFPELVLREGAFDVAVIGDGEVPALQIYQCLAGEKSLHSVKGIGFKMEGKVIWTEKTGEIDLKALPHVDYSVLYGFEPIKWYDGQPSMMVYSGNGCTHKCTFCINSMVGGRYRSRNIEDVIDEIEMLLNKYYVTHIYPVDENFCENKKRFFEFLDLIERRGLTFTWFIQNRVDTLTDNYLNRAVLERMRKLGCIGMLLGLESGSDHMLGVMKKQIDSRQAIPAARALLSVGIQPWLSFMIGMPDERGEDYLATLRLVHELHEIKPYMMSTPPQLYRPIPGSRMFQRAMEWYPEDDNVMFSDSSDFVSPTLPISLQAKICNYRWIQDKKLLVEILACMERFYHPEGFMSHGIYYLKSLILHYCPTFILKQFAFGVRYMERRKQNQDNFDVLSFPVYLMSFVLYYIPAYRRYLIRTNRTPETFNPFLWFKWKRLLKDCQNNRAIQSKAPHVFAKDEHSYS